MLLLGFVVLTFAGLTYRAAHSSLTIDESFSYLVYVPSSANDIISYRNSYTNNHPLNSLLMKVAAAVFGPSELALRLPNLLAFLVYAGYGLLLVRRWPSLLAAGSLILLCSHPTMLEFFGVARGYGLACAFSAMGTYHGLAALERRPGLHLWFFHAGWGLAVLSNFLLLNGYLAAMVAFHATLYIKVRQQAGPGLSWVDLVKRQVLPFGLVVVLLYEPVRRMLKFNRFDFGGKGGFWENTLLGFVDRWWHGSGLSSGVLDLVVVGVVASMVLGTFLCVQALRRREAGFSKAEERLVYVQISLCCIVLAFVLQHAIFGSDYPSGRFLAGLFLPFVLNLAYTLQILAFRIGATLAGAISLGIGLLSLTNVVLHAPRDAYREWDMEAETAHMMTDLALDHGRHASAQSAVHLGVHWVFEPTTNYYRQTRGLDWLAPVTRDAVGLADDYIYEFDSLYTLPDTAFVPVARYARTRTTLWRRNTPRLP